MKPRIKIWRNFRGEAVWRCIGRWKKQGTVIIGRGNTPADAYSDWRESCNFPF